MAQIDSYLKCLVSENELNYLDDLLNLYDFIPNEDLKTLLAVYHTQLNHWFAALNHHINSQYDDDGKVIYAGGYFHAQKRFSGYHTLWSTWMERNITSSPKNNNKLSLVARKRIITQIYRGLSYIHSKGYLHRDIGICNGYNLTGEPISDILHLALLIGEC